MIDISGMWERVKDTWGAVSEGVTKGLDIATGIPVVGIGISAVRAPVGLVGDIATAPWNDDEDYNGFLNTLTSRLGARGADVLQAPLRTAAVPVRAAGEGLEAYNWLWSNVASQPFATAVMTAPQGVTPWGDPGEYYRIYGEAEHTSPGRALTAVAGTYSLENFITGRAGVSRYDLTTADGVNQAVADTPGGSFTSGALDFTANVFLDPTVVAGKGVAALKAARLVLKPGDDIDKVLASTGASTFFNKLLGFKTPEQKGRWLYGNKSVSDPGNPATPALVDLLSHAEDADEARAILRTVMDPNLDTLASLQVRSMQAADKVETLMDVRNAFLQSDLDGLRNTLLPAWRNKTVAELDERIASTEANRAYTQQLATILEHGGIARKPRVSAGEHLRDTVSWDIWQPSIFNTPARVLKSAATIRPGVLNFHEPDSWVNLQRYLDQSGVDRQTKGSILLAWGRAAEKGANEAGKRAVAQRAEESAVAAVARRLGLSDETAKVALEHGTMRRSELFARMKDPAYTSISRDGRFMDMIGDDGHLMKIPVFLSQLQNYHMLMPLDDMGRVLSRYKSELRGREGDLAGALHAVRANKAVTGTAMGLEEIAQAFNNVWKPVTLMSLRYTVRNVTDESLRTMAVHGVVSYLPMAKRALSERHAEKALARQQTRLAGIETRIAEGTASSLDLELAPRLRAQVEGTDELFGGTVKIGPYTAEDLYGGRNAAPRRQAVSARDSLRTYNADYGTILNRMRASYADWTPSVQPADPGYGLAWERAVNDQIVDDTIGKMILDGRTDAEIVAFLRTKDGKGLTQRMGVRGGDPWKWAGEMRTQVETYIPTPELRELAAKRHLKLADLESARPNPLLRPIVHGESLAVANRSSRTLRWVSDMNDRIMDTLGAAPLDVVVRHPFAKLSYDAKLRELIEAWDPGLTGKLDDKLIAGFQSRASAHAMRQVRTTLYDLTEQPNIARTLRFVMPFYGAWWDSVTRWGKIFVENPDRIGRAMQVWTMPDRAGWTTTVDQFGEQQEVIVMPVPEWAKDHIPGMKSLGSLAIGKEDLLAVTSSQMPLLPGAGPLVAIPAAQIARDRPDLTETLEWFLPFGAGKNALDLVLPAWQKRLVSMETEDRQYTTWWTRIFLELEYERNIGRNELTDDEIIAEAKRRADSFYMLRTVANLTLPAPQYNSPYQLYWDKARDYRDRFFAEEGPPQYDSWEDWFLAAAGDEFFPFTQAMSKSVAGITPTAEGFQVSQVYRDEIGKYPELGGLIAGDLDDSGEFSQAVYEWQFGAGQRKTLNPEEALREQNVSAGWREWINASEAVNQIMAARGLTSLSQRGAEDLSQFKNDLRLSLAERYRDWYEEFVKWDPENTSIQVSKMAEFASDEKFDDRAGFASLREYLSARAEVVAILRARNAQGGSLDLQAEVNADLKAFWDTFTGELVLLDPAFGKIHSRYLDQDRISRGF